MIFEKVPKRRSTSSARMMLNMMHPTVHTTISTVHLVIRSVIRLATRFANTLTPVQCFKPPT